MMARPRSEESDKKKVVAANRRTRFEDAIENALEVRIPLTRAAKDAGADAPVDMPRSASAAALALLCGELRQWRGERAGRPAGAGAGFCRRSRPRLSGPCRLGRRDPCRDARRDQLAISDGITRKTRAERLRRPDIDDMFADLRLPMTRPSEASRKAVDAALAHAGLL